jgi:putative Mn2+ efflux pump MntP
MNFDNLAVKHKAFGDGVVVSSEGKYLKVRFSVGEKTFVYPDIFEKFLTLADGTVSDEILADLGRANAIKQEIKEKKQNACSLSCPDCKAAGGEVIEEEKKLAFGKIVLQAVATSIDALAVGVSLRMAGGLAFGIFGTVGVICAVTFALSLIAVYIGKAVGAGLADKAEIVGGVMLVLIGLKLLLEGLL